MHRTSVILSLLLLAGAPALVAQGQRAPELHRNAEGHVFDFHPDGAWRVRARQIAAVRRQLLQSGNIRALNAPMAAPSPAPAEAAITGTLIVPAILFRFNDAGTAPNLAAGAGDTSRYRQLLFDVSAPTGLGYPTPYSYRSYYSELSNGLLTIQGTVIGWTTLANPEVNYTGGTSCTAGNNGNNCNGIRGAGIPQMQAGLIEAINQNDATTNFGLYDNDGPDGSPNSGDDDGYVDIAVFMHSEVDGACTFISNNGHLWSHRSRLPTTGGVYPATNDARSGGGFIRVRDYILQSGLGGTGGCTTTNIMSVGTIAHETGHGFGIPDLYDTDQVSEGTGNWSLMGSGNQSTSASPARMDAWSLSQLGWVTVRQLTANGTYSLGPAPTSDTTFLVRVQGGNTRGEYFLIENRQAGQSDTALIRTVCSRSGLTYPANCRGGLAIWHIDSTKIAQTSIVNDVNAGTPQGVRLVQADNLQQLNTAGGNRGDAGDVWPGFGSGTPKPRYSFDTSPAALKNLDGSFVGFEISSITQITPDGPMSFVLTLGGPTVVRGADTTAKVIVNGVTYSRFSAILASGSSHSISMDSAQTVPDGKTQFVWQSWSDGGGRSHNITGSFAGDSISATTLKRYKIQATTQGSGSVVSAPVVNHTAGAFVDSNSTMTLTATASGGMVFSSWIGDTTASTNPLVLNGIRRGYVVTANFNAALAQTSGPAPNPVMGKSYIFNLTASGGTGTYTWSQTGGAFPLGMSLGSTGAISGVPEVTGSFSVNVRVTSGAQTADGTVNLTVTEPTVAQANALGWLLGTPSQLTADDRTYLDLIGNKNNNYDLGDFLAWVERTNATPAPRHAAPRPEGDPQ